MTQMFDPKFCKLHDSHVYKLRCVVCGIHPYLGHVHVHINQSTGIEVRTYALK